MARPQGKTRAQTSLSLPDLAFIQNEKSQILKKCQNGGKCDLNAEFEERRKESIKKDGNVDKREVNKALKLLKIDANKFMT